LNEDDTVIGQLTSSDDELGTRVEIPSDIHK